MSKTINLCIVWSFLATFIYAGERTDFKVNDDRTTTSQTDPDITVAPNGSFVICWVDRRNTTNDIYIQRFDSTGLPNGANQVVNDELTSAYQMEPAIASDYYGRYSVVWKDYRNGDYPFDPSMYFQRYDSALNRSGSNIDISTEQSNITRESPDIAVENNGDGIIVWADYRNNEWDIYGQRITAGGSLIGSNFLVNDISSGQQHAPKVALSEQGWFVVSWYDNRSGNDDIYCQLFNATGVKIGSNIKISNDAGMSRQAFPDVATDGSGHFTVVWVDWRNGIYPSNPDIYSRK